jgi:hypothetical protein
VALAIDGSTPAVVTSSSTTVSTLSTASFTPPASALLLNLWAGNSHTATNPSTPTITDNLGGHLTYTLTDWQSRANSPTVDGQAAAWWANVGSSAAMTVTTTINVGTDNEKQQALGTIVLTDTSTPTVGAHGKSGSTSAASIAQSYTATATGSWGFIVVTDWDALGSMTAGTGCTLIGTGTIPTTQISYGLFRRTTADGTNGGTTTLNVNLAGTSTHVSWVYVEVVSAATTAAVYPPYRQGRRRFVPPRYTRPLPRAAMPVPAQLNPPYPPAGVKHPLRVRALLPRVGGAAKPVPPQLLPPYPPAGVKHPGRLRNLLPRRGRAAQLVPAQIVITAPTFIPQAVHARIKAYAARRRPTQFKPPDQPGVIQAVRARLRVPRPTRGHIAQPAPAQTAPTPPAYVPQGLRTRVRSLRLFRARTAQPVPSQVAAPAPTFVPNRARQATVRLATARRGHGVSPPVPQAPAPLFTRLKLRAVRVFRGKPRPVVPDQVIVVQIPTHNATSTAAAAAQDTSVSAVGSGATSSSTAATPLGTSVSGVAANRTSTDGVTGSATSSPSVSDG